MNYIYFVNFLISLLAAGGLWLVWHEDRQQRLAKSMAIIFVLNGLVGIAYVAFKSDISWLHLTGILVIPLGIGLIHYEAMQGVRAMACNAVTHATTVRVAVIIFIVSLTFMVWGHYQLMGVLNAAMWMFWGACCTKLLWRMVFLERLIGYLMILYGANSLLIALYGEPEMHYFYVGGIVLRVALGVVIMASALLRGRMVTEREKSRYQLLSQNAPVGIIVATATEILHTNPAADEILLALSKDVPMAELVMTLVPQELVDRLRSGYEAGSAENSSRSNGQRKMTTKAGTEIYLRVNAWPVIWEERAAIQLMLSDETAWQDAQLEVKSLENKNEQQRIEFVENAKQTLLQLNQELESRVQERTRQLENAIKAKQHFVANMSHEIRTPMNAVLGLLQLLMNTAQSPLQHDYTVKAHRTAMSLLSLLNDVLDFSSIDAGKLKLEIAPFSVNSLLQDLSTMVSALIASKPVEVLFDIDENVPGVLIGDVVRLQQVVLNLLSNAVKFTDQGHVLLNLKLLESNSREVIIRFSVRDTGVGIAPENLELIFKAFEQADASNTRQHGGSGLGLAISRQLLALVGSELQVTSTPNIGSTFSFDLRFPASQPYDGLNGNRDKRTESLRVLLVDDNPEMRTLFGAMAQQLGWLLINASSGPQALEVIESAVALSKPLFDVVFVDWRMQPWDGWETLRRLRAACPPGAQTLWVMLSAYGRDVLNKRSIDEQKMVGLYLGKPFTAGMLKEAVESALNGASNLRHNERSRSEMLAKLNGMRILLVEDNALNQLVATHLLQTLGATIVAADNGEKGVQLFADAKNAFDAVLMDLQMPVMDGFTATEKIRQLPHGAHVPIIAMTANTAQSDREACIRAGMNAHVGKPFDVQYLSGLLLELTGRAEPVPSTMISTSTPTPTSTVPPATTTVHKEQIEDTDEFDVQGAIAAMGDDRELYEKILQAFIRDLVGIGDTLRKLVGNGDREDAIRFLHTLKGTSGTVGALKLARQVAIAESQFKNATGQSDMQAVLAGLEQDIRVAIEKLERL